MGLLAYMAGGALKGVGDAMVNKAKQEREDTLLALAEANKRTDMATEQNYRSQNIDQQGNIQSGLEDKRIGGEKDIAGINNDASMARTNAQEKGANTRNAATISGENTRNAATISGENTRSAATNETSRANNQETTSATRYAADARENAALARVSAIANQNTNGKPLTYNQALLAARQAYAQNYKAGIPMSDSNGDPIPAEEWAKTQADKLMSSQAASRQSGGTVVGSGGGLLNPSGAPSLSDLPSTVTNPSPNAAPPLAAVDMLTKDPNLADYFDQKYGQGAAAAALRQ